METADLTLREIGRGLTFIPERPSPSNRLCEAELLLHEPVPGFSWIARTPFPDHCRLGPGFMFFSARLRSCRFSRRPISVRVGRALAGE